MKDKNIFEVLGEAWDKDANRIENEVLAAVVAIGRTRMDERNRDRADGFGWKIRLEDGSMYDIEITQMKDAEVH